MHNFHRDLQDLNTPFLSLPDSLPINPSDSNLRFELDAENIEDEGWGMEFNHRMEVAWESWKGPIEIRERGERLSSCVALLREAIVNLTELEQDMWMRGWIEKLQRAAIAAGAQPITHSHVEISDDDSDNNSTCSRLGPSNSNEQALTQKPKLRQSKLSFTKVTRDVYLEQCAQQSLRMKATTEAIEAAEAQRKEQKILDNKVKDRLRKQEERARAVQQDIDLGRRDSDGKIVTKNDKTANESGCETGTEQARMKLMQSQAPKKPKKVPVEASEPAAPQRVCWQAPAFWVHIVAAVEAEGMEYARKHPTVVIKRLQTTHRDSGIFNGLGKGVLRRWFATDSDGATCWSDSVLAAVERESRAGGIGRSKKLASHPDVVAGVTQQLIALRNTNVPVSCALARSILMAHARVHAPDLDAMEFSNTWLHSFMKKQMGWAYRTATKAARKRPADWKDQCLLTFLRISRTIMRFNIKSPRLIVNADQTGISLLPLGNKTWNQRGADQVSSVCHDERRQFTTVVASSCGGDILPFQTVWGGSTEASLPSPNASRREEANKCGFTYAHGDTRHWSSLDTTKEVVATLVPYLERVRKEEGLPSSARAVLYIDCWPVHTAKSTPDCFLPWMATNYPELSIIFVPAGCTGEFQPADTMLQRIIKHIIKQAALDFFAGVSTRLLREGRSPETISQQLPRDLPTLRNASVAWTLEAYNYLQKHREIVKKSWEKCQTGDWNLDWNKLTSPEATELFFSTVATNESFRNEVASHEPVIPSSGPEFLAEESGNMEVDHLHDPTDDLTLSAGEIAHALTEGGQDGSVRAVIDEDGMLQRIGDESDIECVPGGAAPFKDLRSDTSVGTGDGKSAPSTFVADIAVLGGTHPAALADLSAKGIAAKNPKSSSSRKRKRESNSSAQVKVRAKGAPPSSAPSKDATKHPKKPRRPTKRQQMMDVEGMH